MARFNKIVDLYYTDDGDFFLGDDGDLLDTSLEHYRGFVQAVHTVMMSAPGDWASQPSLGVGLSSFLGKRNTPETARTIKEKIYNELFQDDLLRGNEVSVDVLPITNTQLAIAVLITPPGSTGRIVLTYTYDMRDNIIMIRSL